MYSYFAKCLYFIIIFGMIFTQKLLVPMDQLQTDHLKAYGIAFWSLKKGVEVDERSSYNPPNQMCFHIMFFLGGTIYYFRIGFFKMSILKGGLW